MTLANNIGNNGEIMPTGPSDSQLFGPLAIYNHYERSKRLAKDLEETFLGPNITDDAAGANKEHLQVLFVARDGITEDKDAPRSTSKRYPRFFHPSFIESFSFNGTGKRSLYEWIRDAANLLQFKAAFSSERLRLVFNHLLPTAKAYNLHSWEQRLNAKDAFERLVDAYSHLEYAGGTPSVLDRRLSEFLHDNPGCFPFFHIYESNLDPPWIKAKRFTACDPSPTDLSRIEDFEDIVDGDIHTIPASDFDVEVADFYGELAGDLKQFFSLCDRFFRRPKAAADAATSFKGIVLPLYDRWERNGLIGAFLGWLFIQVDRPDIRNAFVEKLTVNASSHLYREILRANLNDFADSISEHTMDEELAGFVDATENTPVDYFIERFHHIDGWIAAAAPFSLPVPERRFFWTDSNGMLLSSTNPIPATEWRLSIRLDDENTILLTPKFDSILPELETPDAESYGLRVTSWAKTFWDGLKHLEQQRRSGLREGWEEHLEAMSHEARRIIRRVRKSERSYVLTIVRRYLYTLLLSDSPSDRASGKGITPESVRLQVDCRFAEETDIHAFVAAMLHQAAEIQELAELETASAPFFESSFRRRVDEAVHSFDLTKLKASVDSFSLSDAYPTKVMVGCALVCALRNILKHRDSERPAVGITLAADRRSLQITNYGRMTTNSQGFAEYSSIKGGTFGAVSRYVTHYLTPEERKTAALQMPGSPDFQPDADGRFISILPLPSTFLCQSYT
ncbi:MAG TPA: hypothetical protein PLU30_00320 [Verrucomicrobiae bacterium]|nr:hypothetical protein [Verrucomicrobiae bacterium]